MSNPFAEQLLKAGLVTEKQVKKAEQEKNKKKKQLKGKKPVIKKEKDIIQQKAAEKTNKDRELNQQKELRARQKAISIEIDQLIRDNKLARDESCETVHQFQHKGKIFKIYVDDSMKQKLTTGNLGIARIEGRYEVIPKATAEKIMDKNDKRVILIDPAKKENIDAEYAAYEVPDDLMW